MPVALVAPLAVAAIAWLWFIARGKASGSVKRLGLRATLLVLVFGLVAAGMSRGVFARASLGFRLAILLALLAVVIGYLYLVRFCDACGRMERNLKLARCARCGGMLPLHGMTARLNREAPLAEVPRQRARPGRR